MEIVLAGIALGFSLIISIGPQNVFLIKQGIRRESVTAIVAVCLISDLAVYIIAVTGVGVLVESAPGVLTVLKWVGVVYLGWFALQAFRDAIHPQTEAVRTVESTEPGEATPRRTNSSTSQRARQRLRSPVVAALMITWVNPNTWVDAVVIGGIATQYGETGRWLFIVGTMISSLVWFPAVGYGAGALSRPLSRPEVWRVLNVIIGIVLTALTIKLALL